MLKHRIIPCVLLKDWQLTKSINFNEFRTIGHPKVTARIYNNRNVDELIVLDIDASIENKKINFTTLADIAEECYMPLTLGGGIQSLEDINKLLKIGADKISLNTIALQKPSFIQQAAEKFGSQCIVISIDIKKIDGQYYIYNKNLGGIIKNITLDNWIKKCEKMNAGEILLTSVDLDGTEQGYDTQLLKNICQKTSIPVIANGGAGVPQDCVDAIKNGADAIAAASIFHFSQYTPLNIKEELYKNNYPVRKIHKE